MNKQLNRPMNKLTSKSLNKQIQNIYSKNKICGSLCLPVKIQLVLLAIISVVFIGNIIYLIIYGQSLGEFDSIENHKLKLYYMVYYILFSIFIILLMMYLCEQCMYKTAFVILLLPYILAFIVVGMYMSISNNPNYPIRTTYND